MLLAGACEDRYDLPDGKIIVKPDPKTDPEPTKDTLAYSLTVFPAGSEPAFIGKKVTEHFIDSPHSNWGNMNKTPSTLITYPDVCAWLGGLWFAETTGDDALYDRLVAKFDLLFGKEKNLQPSLATTASNVVDYYVFGAIPLCIYQRKKESKYLDLGLKYADGQWNLRDNATSTQKDWASKGYSWQTRLWIDDMFMITSLQAQAFLATGDRKYYDRTVKEMVLYLDRLQLSNGLFYHSSSAKYIWGRGDGWMAVGMAEILRMMPSTPDYDEYRKTITAAYQLMMSSLLKYQKTTGMWGQLVNDAEAWPETSGTAMFTYAMAWGVKNGLLDRQTYGAAVRKAYLELLTFLTPSYDLKNVCEGTGAQNDHDYYLNRARLTGDLHGQAAMIWCCNALCK